MKVSKIMFGVVNFVWVLCVWPCSEASYWGVCLCEYDVREYVPVHHCTGAGVCCVIVSDSIVRFDLSDVRGVSFCVSVFDDVVSVCEEVFMCVVCVSEGVDGVVAEGIDAEGAICEDLYGGFLFV